MTAGGSAEVPVPGERAGLRLGLVDWLVVALGIVWAFAGIDKALDFAAFSEVIALHGVLPGSVRPYLLAVPLTEIALGVSLLVSVGGPRRGAMLRATLLVGAVLLVSLAVYLMLVPAAVLEDVGCGCFGQSYARLVAGMPVPARLIGLSIAGAMLIAHTFAFERFRGASAIRIA